jgi:hypothetical protein
MGELMKFIAALAAAGMVAGCASSSSDIRASYVSPIQYQSYTCKQLGEEAERVSARAIEVAGLQDSARTQDAVVTTVGVVVLWPVLFAIKGDRQTAADASRARWKRLRKSRSRNNVGSSSRGRSPRLASLL